MRAQTVCLPGFVLLGFCLLPGLCQAASPLTISQIKTQGESANDEFIELVNTADVPASLNGLKLIKETSSGKQYTLITFGNEQVAAKSYYLVALKEGSFAGVADATYNTALADNNKVRLLEETTTIALVGWGEVTGSDVKNPLKTEAINRTWQEVTGTWMPWLVEVFTQAHHRGDLMSTYETIEATPVEIPAVAPAPQPVSPTLLISELQLSPLAHDQAWLEIENSSEQSHSLEGWQITTGELVLATLGGALKTQGLFVAFWPPELSAQTTTIRLLDNVGAVRDQWEISQSMTSGSALIRQANAHPRLTFFPTAGRPNVEQAAPNEPVCPATVETTSSPTPSAHPAPMAATPLAMAGRVRINEVLANPVGDEDLNEFIELYNEEPFAVSLTDFKIADTVKTYVFKNEIIEALGYLVLHKSQTGITLNNTTETVTLTNPTGTVLQTLSYQTTNEGLSENVEGSTFYEAVPTPGQINAAKPVAQVEAPSSVANTSSSVPASTSAPSSKTIPSMVSNAARSAPATSNTIDPHIMAIRLNELFPDPSDDENLEWIELVNPTTMNIHVVGLALADAAKTFLLPDVVISAGGFLLVNRQQSGIALNNDKETVRLLLDKTMIEEIAYDGSFTGQSLSKNSDGDWQWSTEPTPNRANIFAASTPASEKTAAQPSMPAAATSPLKNTVVAKKPKAATSADSKKSSLSGTIIVSPGTFQARAAVIESSDGQKTELYMSQDTWPSLELGDVISVDGKKSTAKSVNRFLVATADDITLTDHSELAPQAVKIGELDQTRDQGLVTIQGVLAKQSKQQLVITQDGKELLVRLSKAKLTVPNLLPNSELTVTGLFHHGDKAELWPRSLEDIVIEEPVLATNNEPIPAPTLSAIPTASRAAWIVPTFVFFAALLGGLAYVYREQLQKQLGALILLIRHHLPL